MTLLPRRPAPTFCKEEGQIDGATIAWQANVIGFGKVAYGISSPGATVQDTFNITDHAIDRGELASATGQFTTAAVPTTVVFTEPRAEPRVISVFQISTVSILTKNQGNPVPGVVVGFAIGPSSGSGTLSSAQATTDANGIASVQLTGFGTGLIHVQVTAPNATNSPFSIPVVVR